MSQLVNLTAGLNDLVAGSPVGWCVRVMRSLANAVRRCYQQLASDRTSVAGAELDC